MPERFDEEIYELSEPLCLEKGLELVDVRIFRSRGNVTIEVFADRPRGGITIDECAELNKILGSLVDEMDIFPKGFNLSVSSPGLDWPLKTERDFSRVINRPVRIHLSEKWQERLEYQGVVEEVADGCVKIRKDDKIYEIPMAKINNAVQIV